MPRERPGLSSRAFTSAACCGAAITILVPVQGWEQALLSERSGKGHMVFHPQEPAAELGFEPRAWRLPHRSVLCRVPFSPSGSCRMCWLPRCRFSLSPSRVGIVPIPIRMSAAKILPNRLCPQGLPAAPRHPTPWNFPAEIPFCGAGRVGPSTPYYIDGRWAGRPASNCAR